jgi:hypothetical protein
VTGDEVRTDPALDAVLVSNEFAAVTVRKVRTRNGERLEIRSLRTDRAVLLDAISLEALTWSTALEVGQGLETPLGPDPGDLTARATNFGNLDEER